MPQSQLPLHILALTLAAGCAPSDPADPAEEDTSSSGDPNDASSSGDLASSTGEDLPDDPTVVTTTEEPGTSSDIGSLADPECTPHTSEPCAYTGPAATDMVGACHAATRSCDAGGHWGACRGEVLPQTEDCSTPADDNCDGETTCTGAIEWARSFGEADGGKQGTASASATAIDSQGRLWITGRFDGSLRFGATSRTSSGDNNYFLARLNADGAPQFAYADVREDATADGIALAVDPDDNVAVGAYAYETLKIASSAPIRASDPANAATIIGLLDPQGNYRHDVRMASTGMGWISASDLAYDGAGNLWIAGYFYESNAKLGTDADAVLLENHGNHDGLLMKLTPDGTIAWAHSFGDSNDQRIHDLAVDDAGDVWLVGTHRSTLKFQGGALHAPVDDDSQFIVKLDGDSNWLWGFSYGGPGSQDFSQIRIDASGDAVVAGEFAVPEFDLGGHAMSKGDADEAMQVARYDTDGNVLWAQSWPCLEWCAITSLAVDGAGQAVIATAMDAKATLTIADTAIHGETDIDPTVVVKLDRTGTPVWTPRVYDASVQLATAPGGSIYLTGDFAGTVSLDGFQVNAGPADSDLYVARLRP